MKLYTPERRKFREKYYKTKIWLKIRSIQLRKAPICEVCLSGHQKRLRLASVCDHKEGWTDWKSFVSGPFQSLCREHHQEKTHRELQKMRKAERTRQEVLDV